MALFDRFRKKKKAQAVRQYQGAGSGRLFGDFLSSTRSADADIRYSLRKLRNRCRDLAQNNEYVRRYLDLLQVNVVGERGIAIQSKSVNSDKTLDNIANVAIEREWNSWTRLGKCTVDGKMDFVDCQNLVMESLARDGECFVRLLNTDINENGFSLEFIEADLIDEEKNDVNPKTGNEIRMGVELNKSRRPVAYYVLTKHPGDYQLSSLNDRTSVRVDAENILHLYQIERVNQTRGVPWLSASITDLHMLHGYREAELVAARTAASKVGFFVSRAGDGFLPDDLDQDIPMMDAEPGTFHQLPKGVEFQSFDPSHPTSAFADFERSILRGIASGLGVSYHSLANDLTQTSYSSIRQGSIEDRDFYKKHQQYLIKHFVEPVFRAWLTQVMTKGLVSLPIEKFDKFSDGISYRPRGFQWIDPMKEINAQVIGLQNGLLSLQDVESVYGRDVEENFAQIQKDKQLAEQYGLKFAFEPFGGGASGFGPIKIDPEGEPFGD